MMHLRVARGEFPKLRRPLRDATNKLLLRGLIGRESTEQAEQARFVGDVGLELGFLVDFDEVVAEVCAGGALAGFEEEAGAAGEEVDGVGVGGGFVVAVGDGADLLVRFVVVAFFNSGWLLVVLWCWWEEGRCVLGFLPRDDFLDLC